MHFFGWWVRVRHGMGVAMSDGKLGLGASAGGQVLTPIWYMLTTRINIPNAVARVDGGLVLVCSRPGSRRPCVGRLLCFLRKRCSASSTLNCR